MGTNPSVSGFILKPSVLEKTKGYAAHMKLLQWFYTPAFQIRVNLMWTSGKKITDLQVVWILKSLLHTTHRVQSLEVLLDLAQLKSLRIPTRFRNSLNPDTCAFIWLIHSLTERDDTLKASEPHKTMTWYVTADQDI